jgi:hypothetical protein
MEISIRKIEDLKQYDRNPRKNDKGVDAVAESIREFGFKVPIIIDKNGVIVAGHTRLKAAMKLGMEEVPCIVADDLTESQIKAFRIADNRASDYSTWDFPLLVSEIQTLGGMYDEILNVADFEGLLEEFNDVTKAAPEAEALMEQEFCLVAVFVDEASRDAAKLKIKDIGGCVDVRVKR